MLDGLSLIVTVADENGNLIGTLLNGDKYFRGGRKIPLNSEGKLIFNYRAGTTVGTAIIRVYADYGKEEGPAADLLRSERIVTLTEAP